MGVEAAAEGKVWVGSGGSGVVYAHLPCFTDEATEAGGTFRLLLQWLISSRTTTRDKRGKH